MAGKRHKPHHEEEHENEERWLVSFADMMTLLFCLFMVLFAISSVNTSKFEALQRSLKDAFSGAVLDGGKSMLNAGSDEQKTKQSAVEPPLPSMRPLSSINDTSAKNSAEAAAKAKQEEQNFQKLKRRVDKLAKDAGVALTPAGSAFPRSHDPDDTNIRLAPTFPELPEVRAAMEAVATCVLLAAAESLQN